MTRSCCVLSVNGFTIKKVKGLSPVARIPDTFNVLIIQDESAALLGGHLKGLAASPQPQNCRRKEPHVTLPQRCPSVPLICILGGCRGEGS